jgi:Ca2+-binding EF-hand superfamily protein
MIQVGYRRIENNELIDVVDVTIENTNMPEVNNALDLLQSSLSGRTDIHELFAQEYLGEDDEDGNRVYHKFVFQDLD